jgi:hypothetical protein
MIPILLELSGRLTAKGKWWYLVSVASFWPRLSVPDVTAYLALKMFKPWM